MTLRPVISLWRRAHWFADEDMGEDADQGAHIVEPDSDAARLQMIAKSCLGSLHGERTYHYWADLTAASVNPFCCGARRLCRG